MAGSRAYRGGENAVSALECRDAATGDVVWTVQHPAGPEAEGFVGATFAIAGGRVFLHDESNLAMGRITPEGYEYMASVSVKGPAAPPVPANGRLYMRSAWKGHLTCFDAAEGKE